MTRDELFDSFGGLNDELLKRSEQRGQSMKKRGLLVNIVRYGSIAACLALGIGVGTYLADQALQPQENEVPDSTYVAESSDVQTEIQNEQVLEKYVDVAMLLAKVDGNTEQAQKFAHVEISENMAIYYNVESVGSDKLQESTGIEIEGMDNWYQISGHEDLQYLISAGTDGYELWEFSSFQSDSYCYRDVLTEIYRIDSAEDIAEIVVEPATMDNSDAGKAIQSEIGVTNITDRESVEKIYQVLSSLICYGSDQWEMIGLGDDTSAGMQKQMRAGRYLMLKTTQGMEITSLKYTGITGMFYEYGGIAYEALSVEQKAVVEEILGIETVQENEEMVSEKLAPAAQTKEEENVEVADAPVDEATYSDAREYADELTDLLDRISKAMQGKELPFVTSAGIYENPDRVKVVVNTQDETAISKLKEFDKTGKLLEIKYSEAVAGFEKQMIEDLERAQ